MSPIGNAVWMGAQRLLLIVRRDSSAQPLFLALLGLGIQHPGLGAAGASALLAAYFFDGLLFGALFTQHLFLDSLTEFAARPVAVIGLRTGLLAADFDAAGPVDQLHTGRGLVNLLPALAGTADKMFIEILLENSERFHTCFKLFLLLRCNHDKSLRYPITLSQLISPPHTI